MAKKIQAWRVYGPRIDLGKPLDQDEFIENIVAVTNQSKGSILAVLSEQDVQVESALRSGRIVHLPNGMRLEPVGKKDGSIEVHVRVSPELANKINAFFRGTWINSENIGKTEAEIMTMWNAEHPDDPIDDFEPEPVPAPAGP
jgi:hypothetical protein